MSLESVKYGKFLQSQREQGKIERDTLGEGLYSLNTIGKIERGERYPDKLMRDRLLSRIGESGFDYENYLTVEEYGEWEKRRDILDSLDNREFEKADCLLKEYAEQNETENKVSHQFFLAMRLQYLDLSGGCVEEKHQIIDKAVKLTVPAVDTKPIVQLVLSLQELNLVLQYITYKKQEVQEDLYRQLLEYIKFERFDTECRARLGSKIMLYYCRFLENDRAKEQGLFEKLRLTEYQLELCSQGIEWLRDRNKIYFAWELLILKKKYLDRMLEHGEWLSGETAERYEADLKQTKEFINLLEVLYDRYGIPRETNAFTCFYREYEVYCINDVIRARRRMFGITPEELEDAYICSKKTLKRLERREQKVQMEIAQNLFRRLHLSMEMQRAQIVTDSQEALRLEERYRWASSQREHEQSWDYLRRMKQLIPMEDVANQQYIFYAEKELLYMQGEISKEEYQQYLVEALEYTVPLQIAMAEIKDETLRNGRIRKGEKYLTNMEVTMLKNIAYLEGTKKVNTYWNILKEYFEWLENKCTLAPIIGMYGFVMSGVASCIGNDGEYEKSSKINRNILREELRIRSFSYVRSNLYALLWNDRKQKSLPMTKEDPEWKNGILLCLTVDVYCKDELRAKKMRERLEK